MSYKLLTDTDEAILRQVIRQVLGEARVPRYYPPEEPVAIGGAKLYRFELLEDTTGGPAEAVYDAIIKQADLTLVVNPAPLVDRDGEMSSLKLIAEDVGVCWKYKGKYYYLTSGCGSGGDCTGPFIAKDQEVTGGTVGMVYSWTPATTGTAAEGWGATGLPSGLSIDPDTGEITGTPAVDTEGAHIITLTATQGECTTTRRLTLVIEATP